MNTSAARIRDLALAARRADLGPAHAARADSDAAVRAAALTVLARALALDDGALAEGLADRDPRVRRRACELAVGRLAAALIAALSDAEPLVAEAAAWALGETTPPAPGVLDALVATTRHSDPVVREAAVAALGALGDDRALAAVLAALDDVVTVRRRAVLALAPFAGEKVRAALERATHDRDWQVRNAAIDLLPYA